MIKTCAVVVGAVAMLSAVPASAGVLYDTLHTTPTAQSGSTRIIWPGANAYVVVPPGQAQSTLPGAGPDAVSFYSSSATVITSVSMELNANNPSDGGEVFVYIVPDDGSGGGAGHAGMPTHTGTGSLLAFTGATLIGKIADSALTQCGATELCGAPGQNHSTITLNTSDAISAGEYWLALENISQAGLSGAALNTTATAKWVFDTTANSTGIGTANQLDFNQNGASSPGSPNTYSAANTNTKVFEAAIGTPEPASLAILGVGLAGMGVLRRRRRS